MRKLSTLMRRGRAKGTRHVSLTPRPLSLRERGKRGEGSEGLTREEERWNAERN